MKCPKCNTENPSESKYCKECATQLPASEEISAPTKTIETAREELTTGSTFAGRYQIIEELGKGGMGKVYKAQDTEIKDKVALKLLKPEITTDKETIERFRNELKFARKIVHKNVGRMYDIGREKGNYYITMEYVPGQDLKGLIKQTGQLAVGTTMSIAKQVCEGLVEAHKLGLVHRDLKPSNIMIDQEGSARIMDFGIARSVKGKGVTGAGVIIGTPEYMSPEQVEGKEADQRSDIYSLGVILYEMVTGRVPFEGDTPLSIAVKHKTEAPQDPRELNTQIPDDLGLLVQKCLEKDKEKRHQSAGEVRSELERIEKGLPATEKVIPPKRKPLTTREITVTFGVKKLFIPALLILAVIVAGIIIWRFVLKKEAVLLPSEKQTLAVVSFENMTGDNTYDHLRKIIPNLLITSLEQSGYFQVATWERMHDLIAQMGKEDVEFINRDLGFELCRLEGIDTIVLGSFGKAGDMFATDVKILDVESKKLLKSASSRGEGEGSILKTQIDELSKEISRGIGLTERKIETAQTKISEVATSSMEAYDYYLKGRRADEKLYYDEARQYYEKAVELDPEFASAYLGLAFANWSLGNTKARKDAIDKAMLLAEKASKKERLYIEAFNYLIIDINPEKGKQYLQQLIKEFPQEKRVHVWQGAYYDSYGLYDQALEEYNKALDLDPNYPDALNLIAYTYMRMENFEKALEYFEKYASFMPEDPNPLDSIGELYLQMGRLEDSIAKYKEALEIKPDFVSQLPLAYIFALKEDYAETIRWIDQYIEKTPSTGIKAHGYLWKGFYHYWLGILDHSVENIRKAIILADSVDNIESKGRANWLLGWIHYDRGKLKTSRQHIQISFDLFVKNWPVYKADYSVEYNFIMGLIDLKANRVDSAKSRFKEIESLLTEVQPWTKDLVAYDYLAAEILLAEGFLEKAIAACKKLIPKKLPSWSDRMDSIVFNMPFMKDTLARAYQKKGALDKAIGEYERLVAFDPESKERRLIHPKYHYRLAKLYEQKGWPGKAIEHYEKFLDLWKDADPGIPEVADAKKRLSALQSLS